MSTPPPRRKTRSEKKKEKERKSNEKDISKLRSNSFTCPDSHDKTSSSSFWSLSSPTSSSSSPQCTSTPPAKSSKVSYPNEGVYEGPVSPNRGRHGLGTFRDCKGNQFRGRWENDKPNGMGIKVFASGDRHEGAYVDGKRSGHGIYLYSNGDKYSGSYHEGRMNGYGCFTWASGDSYQGEWLNDQMHGRGVKTFTDGSSLKGKFHRGTAYGICVHSYPGGEMYRGSYVHELRDGYGIYEWADGSFYRGGWSKDRMNGQAIRVTNGGKKILSADFPPLDDTPSIENNVSVRRDYFDEHFNVNSNNDDDGSTETDNVNQENDDIASNRNQVYPLTSNREINRFDLRNQDVVLQYQGDMHDNQFHGYGCAIYGDGSKYEGEFRNGLYHGWGVFMNAIDMDIYEGEFVNGKKQGKGLLIYTGWFGDEDHEQQFQIESQRLENLFESFTLVDDDYDFNSKNLASYGNLSESYQGDWVNDSPEGLGVMVYENGNIYMGSFVNGMRDGLGMMYSTSAGNESGILDSAKGGIWEEDHLIISQPNIFNPHQNSSKGSNIIPL